MIAMAKKREILVEGLKRNLMKIVFTKVNGEERIMMCTLHEKILPEQPISGIKKKINPEVLSVWDVDNSGWRSFRMDSIKEVKVIDEVKELL